MVQPLHHVIIGVPWYHGTTLCTPGIREVPSFRCMLPPNVATISAVSVEIETMTSPAPCRQALGSVVRAGSIRRRANEGKVVYC